MVIELEHVERLSKDLARASTTLSTDEARYLVDAYYTIQGYRIAAGGQVRRNSRLSTASRVRPSSIMITTRSGTRFG